MSPEPPSARARVRRVSERADYDPETIAEVLREGLVAHVAAVDSGTPLSIPMVYGFDGDAIHLHGSPGSRLLRLLAGGAQTCVTVTLLDGLVLARSAFHHSMNFRSVVVLGCAREVTDADEKLAALRTVVEHVVPGRWDECRQPDERELRGTTVVSLAVDEASAKVRTGAPVDDAEDLALPIWAGVLPLGLAVGAPQPAVELDPSVPLSRAAAQWSRGPKV